MKLGLSKMFNLGVFVLCLIFATLFLSCNETHAGYFDDWYYNTSNNNSEGFFNNGGYADTLGSNRWFCNGSFSKSVRCPVIPNDWYGHPALNDYGNGNDSIAQSVANVHSLMSQLKSYYGSGGNNWASTGAAFIINSMLGYTSDSPSKTRNISTSMWDEVENRLVDRALKGKINWQGYFSSDNGDTYVRLLYGSAWDVVYTHENVYAEKVPGKDYNGILIYDDSNNNNLVYRLFYWCANPVGIGMSGLPVASNYSLTPSVSSSSSGSTEVGSSTTVSPKVANSGAASSINTQWQLTKTIVSPNYTIPNSAGGNSSSNPCTYFDSVSYANCSVVSSGTSNFSVGTTNLSNYLYTTEDLVAGTKVCFALSVQPRSYDSSEWAHSKPVCIVVGKKPKVQILGGDLITGGLVNTSTSVKSSTTYGSWDEYAIFSGGVLSGMASAAKFAGGLSSATLCNYSILSFTNSGSSNCTNTTTIGNYTNASSIPDVASSFATTDSSPSLSGTITLDDKQGIYKSSSITINASTISKGRWVVINAPTATISINGNITYTTGTLNSNNDIPQVVIIAKTINVNSNVSQIDAWLIATTSDKTGSINTCNNVAGNLTISTCSTKLTVNGPVMTDKLYLRRTAGSGTGSSSGDPAEVFNLRADAYIWAYTQASKENRMQTVYSTEVSPRF